MTELAENRDQMSECEKEAMMPVKLIPSDHDKIVKKFNFHDVIDYYVEGDIDSGFTMLHNNIWVFIDSIKTITISSGMRPIIEGGASHIAHEAIVKSLNKGITSYSRLYSYVRIRVQGYVKNYYKSMHKSSHAYSYNAYPLSTRSVDRVRDYEISLDHINTEMSIEYTKQYILPAIIDLTPEEKEVFYAKYFSGDPDITYKKISEIMSIGPQKVSRLCQSAIKKIRAHLQKNNITYEDLF